MNKHVLARLGAVTVVALGVMAALAVPASATTTQLEVSPFSGITVSGFVANFGGHPTTFVCAPNSQPDHISPDFDSSGGITLESIDQAFGWRDFVVGTLTLKARWVPTSTTTLGSSSGGGVTLGMSFRVEWRTCDSTTTVCLTNPINVTLADTGYTGAHPHPNASDTIALTGGPVHITVPISCNTVLRSAINSQLATVRLNLHA